jgi:hypothetical protein
MNTVYDNLIPLPEAVRDYPEGLIEHYAPQDTWEAKPGDTELALADRVQQSAVVFCTYLHPYQGSGPPPT